MKYTVTYEKSKTGCGAYAPDLPGCVATGKTPAQVKRLIREAIELHIDSLRQQVEVPEPTVKADSARVSA